MRKIRSRRENLLLTNNVTPKNMQHWNCWPGLVSPFPPLEYKGKKQKSLKLVVRCHLCGKECGLEEISIIQGWNLCLFHSILETLSQFWIKRFRKYLEKKAVKLPPRLSYR